MKLIESVFWEKKEIRRIKDDHITWFILRDLKAALEFEQSMEEITSWCPGGALRKAYILIDRGNKKELLVDEKSFFRLIVNSDFKLTQELAGSIFRNELRRIEKKTREQEESRRGTVWFFEKDLDDMETLYPFRNRDYKVRRMEDHNGSRWYMSSDLAEILGYTRVDTMLNQHSITGGVKKVNILTTGLKEEVTVVDDKILYRLINRFIKPVYVRNWLIKNLLSEINFPGEAYIGGEMKIMEPETIKKISFRGYDLRTLEDENNKTWYVAEDFGRICWFVNIKKKIKTYCKPSGVKVVHIPEEGKIEELILLDENNLYALIPYSLVLDQLDFKHWLYRSGLQEKGGGVIK